MKKTSLPIHPRAATQKILRLLPNRRLRDVIERRFGLASGEAETLEAIGKGYGITRERVRQIEEDGLRRLRDTHTLIAAAPVFAYLAKHLEEHGGVAEEKTLLCSVADERLHPHITFLLTLAPDIDRKNEDQQYYHRWYTREQALQAVESILEKTVDELHGLKKPLAAGQLFDIVRGHAKAVLGNTPSLDSTDAYLSISKLIKRNPYGEFGLASWPTINPSGVRDKAYAVLAKAEKPLHFRSVASLIDKAGWGIKKAHPQTVHNELIKDERFVLVGRGLYALREWGYEPGAVADVIVSVLRKAGRPLRKEEIVKCVLEKRLVKENTIMLNLQNKRKFRKTGGGYTLV